MSLRNPLWLMSRVILFGALFFGYSIIANFAHPLNVLAWTTRIAPDMTMIFPVIIAVGIVSLVGIWLGKQAQHSASDPDFVDTTAAEAGTLPSDLPPGSAGMLVAGDLRPAHISAQLIDLARRGALTLTQIDDEDTVVTKVADFSGEASRIDKLLLETLGDEDRQVLRRVMARIGRDHQRFATALRQPLSEQGLISSSWSFANLDPAFAFWLAWATIVLRGMVRGLSGSPFRPDLNSPVAILLYIVGGLCLLYGVFGQNGGESLTKAGEQARRQWRAFYSWLMGSYTESESDIFERYLPYAVALGAQTRWVEKHASAGSMAAPMWYRPRPLTGTTPSAPGTTRGAGPTRISPPSLNEMSEGLFSSLDQASAGLFGMLNSGAKAFQSSIPQTRSGGGGGGSGFGGPSPGRSSSSWGSSSMSRRPSGSTRSSSSLSRSRRGSSISSSRGSSSLGRSRRSASSSLGGSRKSSSSNRSSSSFKRSSGGSRSGSFRR